MSNQTLRRRDITALALGAIGTGVAGKAFAAKPAARIKLGSGSDTTTTTTNTTTTTSTDTSTYCGLSLDSYNHDSFAGQTWNVNRDTSKSYAIQQVVGTTPPRHRFEVRNGDFWVNDSNVRNRAEFQCLTRYEPGRDVWFSYAIRIRKGTPVTKWNVIGQFHATPDSSDGNASPPFAIELNPDSAGGEAMRFVRRFDPQPTTSVSPQPIVMHKRAFARDHWYHIVGRVVFGWRDDAAVDLWMDGAKIISLANTNVGYNDLKGPYWKFGVYRAATAETLIVDYANMEIGVTSLLSRVGSPLPIL